MAAVRALDLAKRWRTLEVSKQHEFVRNVVRKAVAGQCEIWIEVDREKLTENLLGRKIVPGAVNHGSRLDAIKLTANFQPHRRSGELYLIAQKGSCSAGTPVPSLVEAIVRSRDWYEQFIAGEVGTI